MDRAARLIVSLANAVNGKPYYGPSVFDALSGIEPEAAASKSVGFAHSIWEIVAHIASELRYSGALLDGSASRWVAGATTWPRVSDTTPEAWGEMLTELRASHDALLARITACGSRLDEPLAGWPFSVGEMIEGSIQHVAYHVGQIVLLKQLVRS